MTVFSYARYEIAPCILLIDAIDIFSVLFLITFEDNVFCHQFESLNLSWNACVVERQNKEHLF